MLEARKPSAAKSKVVPPPVAESPGSQIQWAVQAKCSKALWAREQHGLWRQAKTLGGLVPVHLNPSGDWVLSPGARHYPMGGVGHSSATMSIFLETKAPHESTLLDLCMVHMTCSSLQQLNIRYWSYICTCVSDIHPALTLSADKVSNV